LNQPNFLSSFAAAYEKAAYSTADEYKNKSFYDPFIKLCQGTTCHEIFGRDCLNKSKPSQASDGDKNKDDERLTCFYSTGLLTSRPYSLIGPFKVEQINVDPDLVVIHDMVYNSEIGRILETAKANVRDLLVFKD
jgi:hypothetical protein